MEHPLFAGSRSGPTGLEVGGAALGLEAKSSLFL
jgi:hypothetical protein